MVEATFATAAELLGVVDAVRGLLSHATFDCNAVAVRLQGMDAERVMLVDLRLGRAGFARYACERKVSFSVPMHGLFRVLRAVDPREQLTLRVDAPDNHVHFTQRARALTLAQVSLDVERLGVPTAKPDCALTVHSSELARACRDLQRLGATTMELAAGSAGLRLAADAGGGVRGAVILRTPPARPLAQEFAVDYLTTLARASNLDASVEVGLTANMPLRLRFRVGSHGALDLYLAPLARSDRKDAQ
ncbi:pcna [Antheraea pernyi nucleopolyhedrovirus]|uniref:PCNA n=2 Tax=Antheraea pernyi nuclear polyhedrosis virus TaxID=161494 RepID=Q1HGZ8_NPVAP|nr:pcna [Antheraea pernyi nucleopolyhedrovirus]AWD33621.1 PCNA [Antheraea proylei nucleopolyhedrovirus]ABF50335.1 pcna [Antheraea pernyi nucleopolyhedrovirus]ABQ12329.1 PCNA [Antheraea pernyi nucleopolyhedrovirus]AYW35448.1 pcna [Antheraea proylei nucleopolyhedrovirus]BAX08874.1 PCNA [Antheraea pernyi nucleopolyhedrovirus]